MAIKQYGVEPVVKGVGSFISNIGKVSKAIAAIGEAAQRSQVSTDRLNQRAAASNQRVIDTATRLTAAQRNLTTAQTLYDHVVSRINTTTGVTIRQLERHRSALEALTDAQEEHAAALAASRTAEQRYTGALNALANSGGSVTNTISGITTAISLLVGVAQPVVGAIGSILSIVSGMGSAAVDTLKKIGTAIGGVVGKIAEATSAIGGFVLDIVKFAAGTALGKLFSDIAKTVNEMGRDVVKVASQFQRLNIQFTAILARDIAEERIIPVGKAMQEASRYAEGLLEWTTKLAVTTPVTAKEIAQSLALATAYGTSAADAQKLTEATINFTSAMGLEEDQMWRIIYNFGQMASVGRVTGRELRDLSVSFFPINDVLAILGKQFDVTIEQAREMAYEGKISVQDFQKAYIQVIERDFPDAAKKMSRTLSGVTSNIRDFFETIVGARVIGPALDRLTGYAADALDKLLTPEMLKKADILGATLERIVLAISEDISKYLLPSLKRMTDAFGLGGFTFEEFATRLAETGLFIGEVIKLISKGIDNLRLYITNEFEAMTDEATSWGIALLDNFAKGVASAISSLLNVIGSVVRIIAEWFSPGSPPKIAPHIDEWGEATGEEFVDGIERGIGTSFSPAGGQPDWMNETVFGDFEVPAQQAGESVGKTFAISFTASMLTNLTSGFTSVEFDIFDKVSSTIESFIRSLPDTRIDEESIVPRILGTREAIASAVSAVQKGLTTVDAAIRKIVASIGYSVVGIEDYIRALYDVESASRVVEEAERKYGIVQEITLDTLYKADILLQQLSGDIRIQAEAYVDTLRQYAIADAELEAAQTRLNEVTEYYSAILDELQRQLRAVTEEYTENERIAAIDKAIATQRLTAQEFARLSAERQSLLLKKQIRETEDQRDAEVGAAEARIKAAEDTRNALQEMMDAQRSAMLEQLDIQRTLAQAELDSANERLKVAQATIELQIKQNQLISEQLDLLRSGAGGAGGDDPLGLSALGQSILGALPTKEDIEAKIDEIMKNAKARVEEKMKELVGIIASYFGVGSDYDTALTNAQSAWETFTTNLETYWKKHAKPALEEWWTFIDEHGDNIVTFFLDLADAVFKLFTGEKLGGDEIIPPQLSSRDQQGQIKGSAGAITLVTDKLYELGSYLNEHGDQIDQTLTDIGEAIDFLAGAMHDFISVAAEFNLLIADMIWPATPGTTVEHGANFIDSLGELITRALGGEPKKDEWDEAGMTAGEWFMDGLITGVQSKTTELDTEMEKRRDTMKTAGEDMQGSFIDGFILGLGESFQTNVIDVGLEQFDKFIDAILELFGVESPSTVMKAIGEDVTQGFVDGIVESVDSTIESVTQFFQDILDSIKEFLGIQSPSLVMNTMGVDFIQGFIDGINTMLESTLEAVGMILQAVIDKAKEILGIQSPSTVMETAGEDFIQGFINGIDAMIDSAVLSVEQLFKDIIQAIKDVLGINSPSTVMATFGNDLIQGLVNGIDESVKAFVSGPVASILATLANKLLEILDLKRQIEAESGTLGVAKTSTRRNTSDAIYNYTENPQMRATGGVVRPNLPYFVGELGPELFIPASLGSILNNQTTEKLIRSFMKMSEQSMTSPVSQVIYNNIDNSIHISVDANYAQTQSPSSIYWDLTAALGAAGR